MANMENTEEQKNRAHLDELVAHFDTAMLVTRGEDDSLHARPLALAKLHDGGKVYFSTSIDSGKIREIEADPHVVVTMQDARRFVSIVGEATISQDPALIDQLWSEAWKVWFPEGKRDPSLAIISVYPHGAEYWDQGGAKGIRYLFEAAKAYVNRRRPTTEGGDQHAKLDL